MREMPKRKPILCLDFDGVIHSYVTPWESATVIPDPPVDGALEFIVAASAVFQVHVFSSRSNQEGGIEAMMSWLARHAASHPQLLGVLEQIRFPKTKPAAFVTLDDRALTFEGPGHWPDPDLLLQFKPWNKS
jgi:hypothetical protein